MIVDLNKRWMTDDLPCLRREPEMFFVDHGQESYMNPGPKVQYAWDRAKAVCATCPVMKQCARDNLGELDGVWGGLDPAQRIKLRAQHAANIRRLTGPVKEEYAALAYMLREERKLPWADVGRIIGAGSATAQYLYDLHKDTLREQEEPAEVMPLELPETVTVTQINANARFPQRAPKQGDGWVRYGRRVVWGYYLGQTEDDEWFSFKIKLLAQEYSVCWIKAEDVKLTKKVARNVLVRSGSHGSRIYGTPYITGRGRGSQAG